MADRVVHVHDEGGSRNNSNFIIGVIVLIVLAFLFIVYIMPALGGMVQNPGVTVPEQIDVNVNQPNGQ